MDCLDFMDFKFHGLFAFKETILKYLEEKKPIFAVSLDAVKALIKYGE
jgi:hypothetical protein